MVVDEDGFRERGFTIPNISGLKTSYSLDQSRE